MFISTFRGDKNSGQVWIAGFLVGVSAGQIGLDRVVLPYLGSQVARFRTQWQAGERCLGRGLTRYLGPSSAGSRVMVAGNVKIIDRTLPRGWAVLPLGR